MLDTCFELYGSRDKDGKKKVLSLIYGYCTSLFLDIKVSQDNGPTPLDIFLSSIIQQVIVLKCEKLTMGTTLVKPHTAFCYFFCVKLPRLKTPTVEESHQNYLIIVIIDKFLVIASQGQGRRTFLTLC